MKMIDPVCGMRVEIEEAQARLQYNGEVYYFCAQSCAITFAEDPDRYAIKSDSPRRECCGGQGQHAGEKAGHGHHGCGC
ncbi:MAG TPA: YHS domain-containing protein, partial [Symbiobacteriaceae bacterium]|nr:YHS domain-containing protein [Symbiobacteriaceae bacterium]